MKNQPGIQIYNQVTAEIRKILSPDIPFYVAGGYVRDLLMGVNPVDFDFVFNDNVCQIARMIANRLGGAYMALDEERQIARIIFSNGDERLYFDFSRLRGSTIEEDLTNRDLTINAIAIDPQYPEHLIDPCHGHEDIQKKIIRVCNDYSFRQDPARLLRTVRLALNLNFRIDNRTIHLARSSNSLLPSVSGERQRDEIFKIFESGKCSQGLRLLENLGLLPVVFPELIDLKKCRQSSPHVFDVWEHTLHVIQFLDDLLSLIMKKGNNEWAQDFYSGSFYLKLGRFLGLLKDHLDQKITIPRSNLGLLFFAALYHDTGKLASATVNGEGRIHFYRHEKIGAQLIASRAKSLALSSAEIERLTILVEDHMWINQLADQPELPEPRKTYRFFRKTGEAGLDLCILSLADIMATHGMPVPQEIWMNRLCLCESLLTTWYEKKSIVSPVRLISGDDIMTEFKIQPGPLIGSLLEEVLENQAAGVIVNREQALEFVYKKISDESGQNAKRYNTDEV